MAGESCAYYTTYLPLTFPFPELHNNRGHLQEVAELNCIENILFEDLKRKMKEVNVKMKDFKIKVKKILRLK